MKYGSDIHTCPPKSARAVDTGRRACYYLSMNDNGKKKVTIKDIAEACGVSTATVSYVLNGREDQRISPETWKRVMHEVHLMGYESSAVAKALATGNSCAVGLFAPHAAESADSAHAFAAFASALAPALEQRGAKVFFGGQDGWATVEHNAELLKARVKDLLIKVK